MATKHRGAPSQNRDADRHHPVFAQLGPGWAWFADHYSSRVVWIHEGGLHIIRDGRSQNVLDVEAVTSLTPAQQAARWEAIADCLNEAVARGEQKGWWHLRLDGLLDKPACRLVRPPELG